MPFALWTSQARALAQLRGFFRDMVLVRRLEEAMMRITDFTYAFPVLLVAILITAGWGPGAAPVGITYLEKRV